MPSAIAQSIWQDSDWIVNFAAGISFASSVGAGSILTLPVGRWIERYGIFDVFLANLSAVGYKVWLAASYFGFPTPHFCH